MRASTESSANDQALLALLDERAHTFDRDAMAPYVTHFRERFGDAIAGVFFYGSRLAEGERAKGSLYDFFIVFDRPGFHRTWGQKLLNGVLAPNVYVEYFGAFGAKLSTTSLARFRREMSPHAHDIYHQGRFGKRVALVYERDADARRALIETWLAGMRAVVARTLDLMPARFTFEQFLVEVLAISYRGEVRVEKGDKVTRLLDAERPFYEAVYRVLLEERIESLPTAGMTGYRNVVSKWRRFWTRRWLARSRRRMFYRWPKMILTVRNWLDVALAKLERAKGVVLPLTPLQRRHPLIFGWGHLWRVWRKGLFKSPARIEGGAEAEEGRERGMKKGNQGGTRG